MKSILLLTLTLFCSLLNGFLFSQVQTTVIVSTKCTSANSMDPTSTVSSSAPVVTAGRVLVFSPFYYTYRTFVEYNLSGIPEHAIITKATLKLYPDSRAGSPVIHTARITNSWQENSVSWANQPSYTSTQQVTASTLDFQGWLNIDVKNHVQNMVAGVYPNNGWMLYHNNETENANKHYIFRSDDHSTASFHPKLEISYYIPMSVANAAIVHESASGANDGSVSPVLAGGPGGTYTYQWFDKNGAMPGKTALNLSGVPYGWYGVRVTSSVAGTEPFYYAFLVGLNCEDVDIAFNPGPEFIDDAVLRHNIGNTDRFNNYHNTAILNMAYAAGETSRSVLRFRIWLDEVLQLSKAALSLMVKDVRYTLFSPDNSGSMYLLDGDWNERFITFSSQPDYLPSGFIPIPSLGTAPQLSTFDALNSFELWQQNNAENFGWVISPNSAAGVNSQNFHSSDTTVSRPKVDFTISVYNGDCLSYSEMKRKLDGGYSYAVNGKLKFTTDEEYEVSGSNYLPFKIYDKQHKLLESSDINGVMLNGSVAPLPLKFDDNRWILNVSSIPGMSAGEYYILEISNIKGDKRYLRFFYKN